MSAFENPNVKNALILVGRVLIAYLFITAGYPKLLSPAGTAGMIAGAGLPLSTLLAYLAGAFELLAGIAILVGFQTRIAALLLAAFSIFTALVFHSSTIAVESFPDAALGWLNTLNGIIFVKNFALAGGLLVLAGAGAGIWSVDARRS